MWIGIDDTDGPSGGCTTFALTEVIAAARRAGADLIGLPRLVRLDPNVPWKTRGNAALSARFGRGEGTPKVVGRLGRTSVRSYPRGRPLPATVRSTVIESAWDAVLNSSSSDDRADPALVAVDRRLPAELYWSAVRGVVPLGATLAALQNAGGETRTRGARRGLVGAAAAVAWPGGHPTWELLAYREPDRIGTQRQVDRQSVRSAARAYPSLFLCEDPDTRRLMVTPHTRCPILFGLRSTDPAILPGARRRVRSEAVERWQVFQTNQGTGDHLVDRPIRALRPYDAARIHGTLLSDPETRRGGHVTFQLADATGAQLTCWAFEPTKTLPEVARSLQAGDRVRVWGGRGRGKEFRAEGLVLERLRSNRIRVPPRCSTCRRGTKSMGTGRGYRCPGCHRRFAPESAGTRVEPRRFGPGVYHPTPSARRHLAPLGPEPPRSLED